MLKLLPSVGKDIIKENVTPATWKFVTMLEQTLANSDEEYTLAIQFLGRKTRTFSCVALFKEDMGLALINIVNFDLGKTDDASQVSWLISNENGNSEEVGSPIEQILNFRNSLFTNRSPKLTYLNLTKELTFNSNSKEKIPQIDKAIKCAVYFPYTNAIRMIDFENSQKTNNKKVRAKFLNKETFDLSSTKMTTNGFGKIKNLLST